MINEINSFLREKKITADTKISMALLIELLEGFGKFMITSENISKLKGLFDNKESPWRQQAEKRINERKRIYEETRKENEILKAIVNGEIITVGKIDFFTDGQIIVNDEYPNPKILWRGEVVYSKELINDIDFELAKLEDYLHGEEGKIITKIRGKLQALKSKYKVTMKEHTSDIIQLEEKVFLLANELAVARYGQEAVELHSIRNKISKDIYQLNMENKSKK